MMMMERKLDTEMIDGTEVKLDADHRYLVESFSIIIVNPNQVQYYQHLHETGEDYRSLAQYKR